MTTPISDFITREIDKDLFEILQQFSNGLEEVVNFGSNIINWDLNRPTGSDEDLPAILFLRNFLEEVDAISILIKHSSVDPCKNLLRTALENLFYLEYILEKDSKNRALSYLVWNVIRYNKFLTKADGKSPEFNDFANKCRKDKFLKYSTPFIIKQSDLLKAEGKKMLQLPKYLPIKTEYDNTKKRLKKSPPWYSLFNGPDSVEKLASVLNFDALYEVLYRGFSDSIHGTDIIQGKLSSDLSGMPQIDSLRSPKEAQAITQHCINFCLITFKNYIGKRIPDKQNEFNDWYGSIRKFNLKLGQQQLILVT